MLVNTTTVGGARKQWSQRDAATLGCWSVAPLLATKRDLLTCQQAGLEPGLFSWLPQLITWPTVRYIGMEILLLEGLCAGLLRWWPQERHLEQAHTTLLAMRGDSLLGRRRWRFA
jgi:hypothetical protein